MLYWSKHCRLKRFICCFSSCLFLGKTIMEDDSNLTLLQKQMGNERNMTQKYQRRKTLPWLSHFPARKFYTITAGQGECSGYQLWISNPGANYSVRGAPFIKNRRLNLPSCSCLKSQSSFRKWLSSCTTVIQMGGTNCPCCSATTAPAARARRGPSRTCPYASPQDAESIEGRPPSKSPATAPELNIRPLEPPQLNGSGSISKAAESQPFSALSAIQYHQVRSLGGGITVKSLNIMSLTCSVKQRVPVEHKRHTGRRWQITQQCGV